jgi:hypothetical protein
MSEIPAPLILKEMIMIGVAFWSVIWGILGELVFGFYNWRDFVPLLIIPFFVLFRLTNLDPTSFRYQAPSPRFSFERVQLLIVIITTILSIPYLFVISGIMPQDTVLSLFFMGSFGHGGIHHGWIGWLCIVESYFYQRLNRHAKKLINLGILFRNGLLIVGLFLFVDDYWYEEVIKRFPSVPDIFKELNALLPFSFSMNLAVECGIVAIVTIIGHAIYYLYQRK